MSSQPLVSKDRVVTNFPKAYKGMTTPYKSLDYDISVRTACQKDRTNIGVRLCKAVVVGDVAVGKTSLVNRFCHNIFDRDYKATIGVDFEVEKFNVLSCPFTLQLWDTAGQERFKCIAASYYRGANGAFQHPALPPYCWAQLLDLGRERDGEPCAIIDLLLVVVAFDMCDVNTLAAAKVWYNEAVKSAEDPIVFLVGMKKDLLAPAAYQNMEYEANRVAEELNAEFWPTSAKTGENVKEFFFRLVALTFNNMVAVEMGGTNSQQKAIGSSLIQVRQEKDLYERKRRRC